MENVYSETWFHTFLATIDPEKTQSEVDFLSRRLPLPEYRDVLDICCGWGRHSIPLAERGYRVVGIDIDADAIRNAIARAGDLPIQFIRMDMQQLAGAPGMFDAALILWQSFGQYEVDQNRSVLKQVVEKLRPGGRLILDVFHRQFFEYHQGERPIAGDRGSGARERTWMDGDRLHVVLEYQAGGPVDQFQWQLFTPEQLCIVAEDVGLTSLLTCTRFDETEPATASNPRLQAIFEK